MKTLANALNEAMGSSMEKKFFDIALPLCIESNNIISSIELSKDFKSFDMKPTYDSLFTKIKKSINDWAPQELTKLSSEKAKQCVVEKFYEFCNDRCKYITENTKFTKSIIRRINIGC